jgi:hypothetical protein
MQRRLYPQWGRRYRFIVDHFQVLPAQRISRSQH